MVGLLGCGCCGGGGGGGGEPPTSCTRCDGTYFGYAADRNPLVDDFSSIRPNVELRGSLDHRGPSSPVPPNAITDYIRNGKLYAFRSPFIVYQDPDPIFGQGIRAVPPKPVPNTGSWRQPWVWVRRRHDLYFPALPVRKYSFKLNVNYPQNALPRLAGLFPWGVLTTGPFLRVWFGAPENRVVNEEFFSFTVFASNLTINSDTSPNATLQVGISQTNPQRAQRPDLSPTFKAGVSVPWGLVELRLDVTWSPISKSGVREYYVNNQLQFSESFTGWQSPSIPGANCDSFCNFITDIDAIEPWPNIVIWYRAGVPPFEDFSRGNQGFFGAPGPASYAAVTWSAANNPQDRLWFDDYSFDWSNVSGPTVP